MDPDAARSEWDAQFRDDISDFLTRVAVEACVEDDVHEKPVDLRVVNAHLAGLVGPHIEVALTPGLTEAGRRSTPPQDQPVLLGARRNVQREDGPDGVRADPLSDLRKEW